MQLRRGLNCGKIWVLAYFPVFGDLGISLSFWGLFFWLFGGHFWIFENCKFILGTRNTIKYN